MHRYVIQKQCELHGHSASVYTLANGLESGSVLSGSADRFVASWDIKLGIPMPFSVKLGSGVYSLHKTDDKLIVGTVKGDLHVIDLKNRKEERHIIRHAKGVFAISSYLQKLYTGGGDGVLNQWSSSFDLLRSVKVATGKVRRIFPLLNNCILVLTSDGEVLMLDAEDLSVKCILRHDRGGVNDAVYLSDEYLVTGGWDGHLYFWKNQELSDKRPVHNYAIYRILPSPSGRIVATASRDKTIKIWNQHFSDPLARIDRKHFEGHTHSVNDLIWMDNETLMSAGDDKKLMVWRITETVAGEPPIP